MKSPKPASALPRLAAAVCTFLFLFGSSPVARAGALLTNGHPVHVRLPAADEERQIVNGSQGFMVFVPPGAERLVVEFETMPFADLRLLVRFGSDVGPLDDQDRRSDFRAGPNGNGLAQIEVVPSGVAPRLRLQSGIYFIGFQLRSVGVAYEGLVTARVEGLVIEPERVVQESEFDSDLDGWTRNGTPSDIPGTNVGGRFNFIAFRAEGGNPGGYARLQAFGFRGPDEWFVAPDKYLVNFLDLTDPRFVFDLTRITGETVPNFDVQVRVFGEESVFVWTGARPPEVRSGWETFSVSIQPDEFARTVGNGLFEDVFSNPVRIEVRATYTINGGAVGLDNFRLLARGDVPALPVLPTISAFTGGMDGWTRNYPEERRIAGSNTGDAESALVWNDPLGNPGGFLRLAENGGEAPDAFVASDDFLGDWSGLSEPRFEFDYRHESSTGATRPVTIRLFGADTIFEWTGVPPGEVWAHQIAGINALTWVRTAGEAAFEDVLAEVSRIEISADHASGPEQSSLDNFALLTDDSPVIPQVITANPEVLGFPAVATGANPAAQTMQISSSGGELHWEASVSGPQAGRVTLSETSGKTPAIVSVEWDIESLAEGTYQAFVTFTPVGTNIEPSVVTLNLQLGPQPNPTPQITRVVNEANKQPLLSQGAMGAVEGQGLIGSVAVNQPAFGGRTGDMLPTSVNGIRVLIYDASATSLIAESPLISLSNEKITFQMPFEVWDRSAVSLVVDNNGAKSDPASVPIAPVSPGIFTTGDGHAVAFNEDGSANSATSPAARDSLLIVYLTGQGVVAPAWKTGKAASVFPLIFAPTDISVTIGGVAAEIKFFGLAPGMVGVAQLNLCPTESTPTGEQPIQAIVAGVASNEAPVSIE